MPQNLDTLTACFPKSNLVSSSGSGSHLRKVPSDILLNWIKSRSFRALETAAAARTGVDVPASQEVSAAWTGIDGPASRRDQEVAVKGDIPSSGIPKSRFEEAVAAQTEMDGPAGGFDQDALMGGVYGVYIVSLGERGCERHAGHVHGAGKDFS